ncbi:MAG: serine/threonine protein kinase, partial [Chloroflexi bacterium]|nr:serine/threonine protein kinase [Chloroflexota bacterium]
MPRTTRQLDDNAQGESESLDRLQPGTTLEDRYLILGMLGAGGMSSVYKGRDLHFPNVTKLVAIKEMVNLIADQSMHEMIVKNFEREADLLATLSHPATPAIYDNFSHKKRSYLVMEFIDGDDLEAILAEATDFLPEEKVVGWAIELCDVLSYLHNIQPEPIIFRDIKPSNVMIDHHNHVRLIDFGIARNFQPGEKGTMIGTEGYSPPEQYRGEASPAGDVYALGATLHHLLTKRDPRVEAPFSFAERPARSINPL